MCSLGRTVKETIATFDERKIGKKVDAAIEEVGLTDLASRRRLFLSGQFPTCAISTLHGSRSTIYFLDEPFVGIDMLSEKKVIMTILRKWKRGREDYFNGQP